MTDVIDILSSGLSASRLRVNVLSANLANAETTRTPEGGPYRRRDVVQVAKSMPTGFGATLEQLTLAKPEVAGVVADTSAPRLVHNPGHPDANAEGYVAYPNINVVSTMTDLMSASRLYQANVTAIETARRLTQEAIRISLRF